jgi:monothiol glutaredoxin
MKGTPETPQCGFSRATIQLLGLQGVDPKKLNAFNVLEDEALRQGIFGFFTFEMKRVRHGGKYANG